MLTLEWPWLLALLPLPWLYRLVVKPRAASSAAVISKVYTDLARESQGSHKPAGNLHAQLCLTLAWISLLVAAARPLWVGEPVAIPTSGRDLMLAVDISGSMEIEDMAMGNQLYPRLTAVKQVVGDFVQQRQGDKLGLILFGERAYLQTPLTFDHKTLFTLLQEAQIGFAGKSTAIGDAIGIAVKRLQDRPESSRVVILLSDGADTASEVAPLKAAELAAAYHIRIYTVGIGAEQLTRRSLFGMRQMNPSADLDEDTLTRIAQLTGGQYFRARNPEELAQIYQTLDQLEPIAQEAETLRPTKSLFYWPLTLAVMLFAALLATRGGGVNHG